MSLSQTIIFGICQQFDRMKNFIRFFHARIPPLEQVCCTMLWGGGHGRFTFQS